MAAIAAKRPRKVVAELVTPPDYKVAKNAKKQAPLIVCSPFFSLAIPALGYIYLGSLIAFLFLLGHLGAFLLWILIPTKPPYASLRISY